MKEESKWKLWMEAAPNLVGNSTFLFPHHAKTPATDIAHYPFAEKPVFLFIYHPLHLLDVISRVKCFYPLGHISSIYDGVCIDSSFKRNTNYIGTTLRRIIQTKMMKKPFVFLLFPQKMGLEPISLKKKMLSETMLTNDYIFLQNNCATHALRPILGEDNLYPQFGNFISPKEVLQWCDGLCKENKAIRTSTQALSEYLSKLQTGQADNLFGEKTEAILAHYLKNKRQR